MKYNFVKYLFEYLNTYLKEWLYFVLIAVFNYAEKYLSTFQVQLHVARKITYGKTVTSRVHQGFHLGSLLLNFLINNISMIL